MKICSALNLTAVSIMAFTAAAAAQSGKKSPAQVSSEAAEEDPSEQGMEEEDNTSSAKVQDKTGSASGIGLDKSPLGAGSKQDDETKGTTSDALDEAADDILDQSFSQPGNDQDTGHASKKRTGEADVAVPDKDKPLPGVELKKKEKTKQAAKQKETVVIKDKEVIIKIQHALIKRGAAITPDGKMGQSTVDALKEFQTRSGLKADGNPNPATLTKLGIIYIAK
jgi:murein L,D-transpeptidase YcbB/YkuD